MSRPRIAALRLAARRYGKQPLGTGDAAVAASEEWPPAAGTEMPQGSFEGGRSGKASAKMAFVFPILHSA